MAGFKVGVQFEPQHCTVGELRDAWRRAEDLGVDSVWTWDHFFPLSGDPDGRHYEGWTLLAAMACDHVAIRQKIPHMRKRLKFCRVATALHAG